MTERNSQGEKEVVGGLAGAIARLGLTEVSLLALDGLRPLSPLAGQFLWLAQPTLGLFVDPARVGTLAGLLECPDGVERLRRELETART